MSEVIQEYWYIFLVMYLGVFGWIFYKAVFANRGKIKVRVKTPSGEIIKWCKPEEDGETIIYQKQTKKKPLWKFKFSSNSLIYFKSWGRRFFAIDVFYQAPKAIEYHYKTKEIEQALWDKKEETDLFKASVIKAAGATTQKVQIPTLLYVFLFLNIAISFISLLVSSGRVRI